MRVIAFTYDADYHCKDCTSEYIAFNYHLDEYEVELAQSDDYMDSDGNPIHPVFDTDEWWQDSSDDWATLYCGDCSKLIAEVDLSD